MQRRLSAAGFEVGPVDGEFGPATLAGLIAFQRANDFDVDGICGPRSWEELVRTGYRLGDRLLYLQAPMMRGEDVFTLQRRLSTLGFDAGRIDGIFGPDSLRALSEFQRNVGVLSDGICGPKTVHALERFGGRIDDSPIAVLREQEALLARPKDFASVSVAIGEPGGLGALAAAIRRASTAVGSSVLIIHHPDGSAVARQANRYDADVLVSLGMAEDEPEVCYFEVPGFVSVGGRALARLVADRLTGALGTEVACGGRRAPVLRESQMPALTLRLSTPTLRGDALPRIGAAWADAHAAWMVDLDELVHH